MKFRAAVIDTNVVVAGLLTSNLASPTARILDAMLEGNFSFVLSPQLLAEYRQVLLRPKIQARHGLNDDQIDRILVDLVANAIVRDPASSDHEAPEPGDQHLWDLLATEIGSVLVTGDRTLLDNPPTDFSVFAPTSFVAARGQTDPILDWEEVKRELLDED